MRTMNKGHTHCNGQIFSPYEVIIKFSVQSVNKLVGSQMFENKQTTESNQWESDMLWDTDVKRQNTRQW